MKTRIIKGLVSGIMAGVCIGIGGFAYIAATAVGERLLGSFFFRVGLLLILYFGFYLYTGKIGYIFENKKDYIVDLFSMLVGNFLGAGLIGYGIRLTKVYTTYQDTIQAVANGKLSDSWISILVLAILCGILVFSAVDVYKKDFHPVVKVINVIFCIGIFVVCGFEHVVADMFFFSLANVWSWHALFYVLLMVVGNSLGSIIFYLALKFLRPSVKPTAKQ